MSAVAMLSCFTTCLFVRRAPVSAYLTCTAACSALIWIQAVSAVWVSLSNCHPWFNQLGSVPQLFSNIFYGIAVLFIDVLIIMRVRTLEVALRDDLKSKLMSRLVSALICICLIGAVALCVRIAYNIDLVDALPVLLSLATPAIMLHATYCCYARSAFHSTNMKLYCVLRMEGLDMQTAEERRALRILGMQTLAVSVSLTCSVTVMVCTFVFEGVVQPYMQNSYGKEFLVVILGQLPNCVDSLANLWCFLRLAGNFRSSADIDATRALKVSGELTRSAVAHCILPDTPLLADGVRERRVFGQLRDTALLSIGRSHRASFSLAL
mmetsp:Transcript_55026/g.98900  ORF Transcript_55026/g.98900 Transcript_55026/m.98900 type:complete len:323 (+) Transcript_55026:2-970(+)